ncbi:MAG: hypothetical protein FJX29_09840, partial [Alphaproteobacteria bacterium]|nr:hypothetical protein [Alphaproteobacteria bacterium]
MAMVRDRFGGEHGNVGTYALRHYENAALSILTHAPGVAGELDAALTSDPAFYAARALRGFSNVFLARQETLALAQLEAQQLGQPGGWRDGASDVRALCESLILAAGAQCNTAAARLETHIAKHP